VQFVPLPPQCVFTNPTVVTPFNFAASETRVGWTVGAGGEGHSGTNWPVKPEYDGFRHWHNHLPKFLRFDQRRGGNKSGGRQRVLPALAISAVLGGGPFSRGRRLWIVALNAASRIAI
jgi:hypothetical protein